MLETYMKEKVRNNAVAIMSQLREKGIEVPNNFVYSCLSNAIRAGHYWRALGKKDVRNAIVIAEFWSPILKTREDYNSIVLRIIFQLYRNQCIALNNNKEGGALFIGQYCELKDDAVLGTREYGLRYTYVAVGSDAPIIPR